MFPDDHSPETRTSAQTPNGRKKHLFRDQVRHAQRSLSASRGRGSRGRSRPAQIGAALAAAGLLSSLATGLLQDGEPEVHNAAQSQQLAGSQPATPKQELRTNLKLGVQPDGLVPSDVPEPPKPAPAEPAPRAATTSSSAPTKSSKDPIDEWIDQAVAVLQKHGVPPEKINKKAIRTIIMHESGGNPRAVNNWDINAANGTPSIGLMQTIEPTFKSYALPGYTNIYDPVHNIVAATLYALDRYGSLSSVPGVSGLRSGGSYQGY